MKPETGNLKPECEAGGGGRKPEGEEKPETGTGGKMREFEG